MNLSIIEHRKKVDESTVNSGVHVLVDTGYFTSIVAEILDEGAKFIRPVPSVEDVKEQRNGDDVLGAVDPEHKDEPFADILTNPPAHIPFDADLDGKEVVYHSEKAAESIARTMSIGGEIYFGAPSNAHKLGRHIRRQDIKSLNIIAAGNYIGVAPEDMVGASMIVDAIMNHNVHDARKQVYKQSLQDTYEAYQESGEEVEQVLTTIHEYDVVPEFVDGVIVDSSRLQSV